MCASVSSSLPKEPEWGYIMSAQFSLLHLPIKFLISAPKRNPYGEGQRDQNLLEPQPETMGRNNEELGRNTHTHIALPLSQQLLPDIIIGELIFAAEMEVILNSDGLMHLLTVESHITA